MPVIPDSTSPYFVEDHDPPNEADSRVYVNGTQIPVVSVDVYVRKEGPLDVTRYMECEFPTSYNGQPYRRLFNTDTPSSQSEPDVVRVDLRDYQSDAWYPSFYGAVTGVGPASGGPDRLQEFRARGPGHLLSNIPVSKRFEDATAADVVSFIADRLKDGIPFPVSEIESVSGTETVTDGDNGGLTVTIPLGFDETAGTSENDDGFSATIPLGFGGNLSGVANPDKTFTYGKDTLADVFGWLGRKTNLYFWFQPTAGGVTLNVTRTPTERSHDAHYLDGNLHIEENNALAELKPINSLTVKAPAEGSSSGNTNKIAVATARHQGLYERAGNTELYADTHRLTNSQTKTNVEHEARKSLKSVIDEPTAGSINALCRPTASPFDTVQAYTSSNVNEDGLEPFTFEVARVHHHVDNGPFGSTKLNVGVHTDPSGDIEIIDSWVEERGA